MKLAKLLPQNAVILAFEGPDRYSMVGGLGVRVTQLTSALGAAGITTDLFFVGDPNRDPFETTPQGVRLHRWCQWISRAYRNGVYDGEHAKSDDFARSIPRVVAEDIVAPARDRGEQSLIIGEDWQIAPTILALHSELQRRGLRDAVTMMWNANNTYGFDRIDWRALSGAAHITAVSRYMKFEMLRFDVSPMVIPNGIAPELLDAYDEKDVERLRAATEGRHMLLKVGRYDPDKRWMQAIDAVAELRSARLRVQLVMRGGKESYRELVILRAREQGLAVAQFSLDESTPSELANALRSETADVVELRTFLPDPTLYALYGAADAVLANSGREPFGLVGLEVMAVRGIPVCGSTGEDYARAFGNAIVCDTDDPRELAGYLQILFGDRPLANRIRKEARTTAKSYTWPAVFETLAAKVRVLQSPA
jgi:glycosyltransferase involved in cell wall biosynthesis